MIDLTAPPAPDSEHPAPMARPRLRCWTLPDEVFRAYLIGWTPLFVIYMVANEIDGDFTRDFNIGQALLGTLRNIGPAFVLLLGIWPYSGWMERRGFGVTRVLLNHGGMALIFAVVWHAMLFGVIWMVRDYATALRARDNWFIWQAMFGMLMYFAVAGGVTAYLAVARARAEAAASAQAQALLARTELAALRNKLNPHFLFNTLHSIIALTRRDAARAEQSLLMFSDMLRYVLDTEKAGHDQVPLRQELDFIRDYLALEALRLGHRLTVHWQVDDAVLEHTVSALSIQPLVENSIRHAFNPRSAAGNLHITVRLDGRQTLAVDIVDDGPGCDADRLAEAPGLGLRTVARRLALEHGGHGGLRVVSQPGAGFAAHLRFPVEA